MAFIYLQFQKPKGEIDLANVTEVKVSTSGRMSDYAFEISVRNFRPWEGK